MKTRNIPFRTVTMALALAFAAGCERPPERSAADLQGPTPASGAAQSNTGSAHDPLVVPGTAGEKRGAGQGEGAPEPATPMPEAMVPVSPAPLVSAAPAPSSAAPVEAARGIKPESPPARIGSSAAGGATARRKAASLAVMPELDAESYAASADSGFARVAHSPLSTFAIDVDTASYSNVRRFLQQGQLPPAGAVRIEELINYFPYAYPDPVADEPFALVTEVSIAPWNPEHRLLHVGLQAKRLDAAALPAKNLVFLIDVSGSMQSPNKLPLLKRSLGALAETLGARDSVAIAVYAGASGLVLPPTPGDARGAILGALERLEAGGSTNGSAGIELAYDVAEQLARPGATTRVVLATDGDFNVGTTSQDALLRLISDKRRSGVYLSVLGFGMGNLKDSTLELLADEGNGNYAYVDSLAEARKVLVAEGGATLVTVADDVKLQLEFNPAAVGAYRLIGYENRRLEAQNFNDDRKDAGELGVGHGVTALYELVPPGAQTGAVDALRYQSALPTSSAHASELCSVKLRYKAPGAEHSRALERVVRDANVPLAQTSAAFRFSAAVAAFGMTLRASPERGKASYALARELAEGALGRDAYGYQRELISLVDTADALTRGAPAQPLAMP